MNVDSAAVEGSSYGYSDFLRDYLHCDEEALQNERKMEIANNGNVSAAEKEKLLARITRLQSRIKRQAYKRRMASQRKPKIEKQNSGQSYKRKSTEDKRVLQNAYLNFLRDFRKTHTSLRPDEMLKRSARVWVRMTEEEKSKYRRPTKIIAPKPKEADVQPTPKKIPYQTCRIQ